MPPPRLVLRRAEPEQLDCAKLDSAPRSLAVQFLARKLLEVSHG
jgi:hypothetical protein